VVPQTEHHVDEGLDDDLLRDHDRAGHAQGVVIFSSAPPWIRARPAAWGAGSFA
jgi:hypothetical protein